MDELKLAKSRSDGARAETSLQVLEPYLDQLKEILKETVWQAADDVATLRIKAIMEAHQSLQSLLTTLIANGRVAQADLDRLSGRVTIIN